MDFDLRHILPLMIPIVAIVMGIGIAMLAIWTDYKRKREMFELHHKERLLAIERGIEVPPLPLEFFQHRSGSRFATASDYLRRGLIWLLVGVAVMIVLALNQPVHHAAWGLIPFAVGAANLIYYVMTRNDQPSNPS